MNNVSVPLWKWAVGIAACLVIAALLFVFRQKGGEWRAFTEPSYRFSFEHPEKLAVRPSSGTSDLMGAFVAVDVGTAEELDRVEASERSSGAGGPPLFLRFVASRPTSTVPLDCEGMTKTKDLNVGGEPAVQCEGAVMNAEERAMLVKAMRGDTFLTASSDLYVPANRETIDRIVGSVRFVELGTLNVGRE